MPNVLKLSCEKQHYFSDYSDSYIVISHTLSEYREDITVLKRYRAL